MSSTLFSPGLSSMCELTNFLNLSQFVLLDVILEELSLVSVSGPMIGLTLIGADQTREMFFVTARAIKSGRFLGSISQYVGEAGETQSSLLPTL